MASPNYFQAATSSEKLRGRYFTPPELVRLMLDQVDLGPRDLVLDPSCGDGEFLVGAVLRLAQAHPGLEAGEVARRLVGFDVHPETVWEARKRVRAALREAFRQEVPEDQLSIRCANALDLHSRDALARELNAAGTALPAENGRLLVLGNPPYVEAKRLPAEIRKGLRERFPGAANGAPDLYLYFLHVCLHWLEGEDRLAFVLPNKVLVNQNARELRERLLAEGRLRGITFATRAEIFPDAAVYPVVLDTGALRNESETGVVLSRIEAAPGGLRREALPALPATAYRATEARAFYPTPDAPELAAALAHLASQIPAGRLNDVLDIRWSVSFHRQGLRERYVTPSRQNLLYGRKFLGGGAFNGNGEVERYQLSWDGWWINYDEEALRQERNPLPDAGLFEQPKIAICQNSRTLRAAYDPGDYVLKDTFLCGIPLTTDHPLNRHPRALVGLLCSRAVHFFYSHVFYGGHVGGGYLHFLRSFLIDIPLGEWTPDAATELAALVREREAAEPTVSEALEERMEMLVQEALHLDGGAAAQIRRWCEADENWQARGRVRRKGKG